MNRTEGDKVLRSEIIKITLTAVEKQSILDAAKSEGLTASAFVRMAAMRLARQ